MKRTTKYGLAYFEKGDYTTSQPEMQRWETLDTQLYALFNILGNGVISGWNLLASSGLAVTITPGSGHVGFVSVESASNISLTLTASAINYIYVSLANNSYWTKNAVFSSNLAQRINNNVLLLGTVTTNATDVTAIDTSAKQQLGFAALVSAAIKAHRHIGGFTNPSQINLATDVRGALNQDNFPELDASLIQTGTLDPDRLPLIDHITGLKDQGTLTHSQLDDFVNTLSLPNQTTMGETSTTNLLQLILALKHIYPDIDEYLVNELAFIPGISPDSFIDTLNTTANVNTVSHTITGTVGTGTETYTRIWEKNADFEAANKTNLIVNGDSVTIDTTLNTLVIDEFIDINGWSIETVDLSSVPSSLTLDPPNGAKVDINGLNVEIILQIKKDFAAQDWSGYNYLKFSLLSTSVQHGDLFFYLRDAVSGIQSSYQVVLNRNCPTVNQDTLANGWQEITIDLTSYVRNNINEIGFYVSTQDGWDTSKGFSLNLDNIYLTSGNIYKTDGHLYLIYGSNFLYDFWRVRWDAYLPSDSESAGLTLQVRSRCSNDNITWTGWTAYSSTSGYTIPISSMYKYIELDFYFLSSTSQKRAPLLTKAYLDFYAVDVDNSFEYSNTADWTSGYLFNMDTQTVPNSMLVNGVNEIGNIYYGTQGSAVMAGNVATNFTTISQISGTMLPRSTSQVISNQPPAFGLITGIVRGNCGNLWLSDIDNDRVFEIDQGGELLQGFCGSFLTEPEDVYEVANSNAISTVSSINVLHSLYNYDAGVLYIICDAVLENVNAVGAKLNLSNLYLKIGSQVIHLNDADVELLGVDATKQALWEGILNSNGIAQSTSNTVSSLVENVSQFSFNSHVLQITPKGADKALLDYLVNQKAPTITIASPLEQQQTAANITASFLTYNFDLGTTSGEPAIRVSVDNVASVIYTDTITYTGLSSGKHTLKAELLQADGSPYTNIEAKAESTFVVQTIPYALPYLYFKSPRANQVYSSSPASIEFSLSNFAIVPNGQHVRYIVDSNAPVDWYSNEPIVLNNLAAGKHTLRIYTVDQYGDIIVYPYGDGTVEFLVGLNSNAVVKLYVNNNAIYSYQDTAACPISRFNVDVANMYFSSLYAPVDIQLLATTGYPTVLVTKLRSAASPEYLGSQANIDEIVKRITLEAANVAATTNSAALALTSAIVLNNAFTGISTANLVFDNGYVDGHSVVEYDMVGNVVFSNNDGKIAPTKVLAKEILGSGNKLSANEVLIADAYNKRAIITQTNTTTRTSSIVWEYESDRYVSDAQLALQDDIVIEVSNTSVSQSDWVLEAGQTATWENASNVSMYIYSGTLGAGELPDYSNSNGKILSGEVLAGNSYSQTFSSIDSINWIGYSNTQTFTGNLNILSQRVSDRDQYYLVENDGLESPFSSRVIRVNEYGEVLWNFGSGYITAPRDIRPLLNNKVIISC